MFFFYRHVRTTHSFLSIFSFMCLTLDFVAFHDGRARFQVIPCLQTSISTEMNMSWDDFTLHLFLLLLLLLPIVQWPWAFRKTLNRIIGCIRCVRGREKDELHWQYTFTFSVIQRCLFRDNIINNHHGNQTSLFTHFNTKATPPHPPLYKGDNGSILQ